MKKLGASAALRRIGADRWLKLGLHRITRWKGLSFAELADQLADSDGRLDPGVTQAKLNGKPVVVIRRRDGSKLYVANSGVPYPLRGDYRGAAGGRITFSEYGAEFHITAPENPIDVEKLTDRGSG